ncbi:MAG: 2-hydroxychromene-2-carboxylate isomerase [Polaromonas sp.]|uniref:2-hydroxychromene-2-carboxylate isomerase n=1 Tax=Polaromonas sp. TaxID=1869339 RepID=UPI002488CB7D|nr:2-hydroxychromene-2-carboxylate isomerase [Polaromonas sp.]MDI1238517.1 2-hydroxychromene-2-carboxylate isomerase [Polaromonas sp.]
MTPTPTPSPPPAPLHFYFDFISPFGYFASLRIEPLAARHGRSVEWRAMLLGVSVLKVMGLKSLLDTPLKGDYIRRDAKRYMRRHGLEVKRDLDDAVMDPRAAGRAFYWVKHHHPALAAPLAHAIYHAYWAEGRDLSTAEAVAAIALPEGLDAQRLREGIASEEARQWLRSAVEASLQAGIFGSPTVVVDGEPFWGVETLGLVEEWLDSGGW